MNKPVKYTRGPNIEGKVVADFLPPPHMLVFSPSLEKVTITLTKRTIDFFKAEATRQGYSYQRMIRVLLDRYTVLHLPAVDRSTLPWVMEDQGKAPRRPKKKGAKVARRSRPEREG